MKASYRLSSRDLGVLREVKNAIGQMRRAGILYADIFSPMHDEWMGQAAKRLTIMVHRAPLGRNVLEAVSPPVYGRYFMQISTDVAHNCRRFALRHGMGHVVAGHVDEVAYLSDGDNWMSQEERVADVFALADLLPYEMLMECRHAKLSRRRARELIIERMKLFTHDWPDARLADRARLRIGLFAVHNL